MQTYPDPADTFGGESQAAASNAHGGFSYPAHSMHQGTKDLSSYDRPSQHSQASGSASVPYGQQMSGSMVAHYSSPPQQPQQVFTVAEMRHALASAVLRGSDLTIGLSCASMVLSFGVSVVGVVAMTDIQVEQIVTVQSVAFLIAQSFVVSRTWRDWSLCQVTDLARPSPVYAATVGMFLFVAVGMSLYCMAVIVKWHGFYVLSLLWVSISAVLSSKAVRDRDFAKRSLLQLSEQNSEGGDEIMGVCSNSPEYQAVVWGSAAFAVGTTLVLLWSWEEDIMELTMKGFFTLCVFFSQGSTFHLGKLMHDRADPIKSKELQEHVPFQVVVVASSIVSYIVPLLVVCLTTLETSKRFFLLTGLGFMMSSSFFLVKHSKDQSEFQKLMAPLVRIGLSHGASTHSLAETRPSGIRGSQGSSLENGQQGSWAGGMQQGDESAFRDHEVVQTGQPGEGFAQPASQPQPLFAGNDVADGAMPSTASPPRPPTGTQGSMTFPAPPSQDGFTFQAPPSNFQAPSPRDAYASFQTPPAQDGLSFPTPPALAPALTAPALAPAMGAPALAPAPPPLQHLKAPPKAFQAPSSQPQDGFSMEAPSPRDRGDTEDEAEAARIIAQLGSLRKNLKHSEAVANSLRGGGDGDD